MRLLVVSVVLIFCGTPLLHAWSESLLPPPSEFRLTLREDPRSRLPFGPACGGGARNTLTCRAFVIALTNIGPHTVRLSGRRCAEPDAEYLEVAPGPERMLIGIRSPERSKCAYKDVSDWTNTVLEPGKTIEFATRLWAAEYPHAFGPGDHTLKVRFRINGCTELHRHSDCLTPLQRPARYSWSMSEIDTNAPLSLESNEVVATAPPRPNLVMPPLSFTASARLALPADKLSGCTPALMGSIACILVRSVLRNESDQPLRLGHYTCPVGPISVEYRIGDAAWRHLQPKYADCNSTIFVEQSLAAKGTSDDSFSLRSLGYVDDPLRTAGTYQLRISYYPYACGASPDASFCLTNFPDQTSRAARQPPIVAPVITVQTTADAIASPAQAPVTD